MQHVIVHILVFILKMRVCDPFTYAFFSESRKYDEQLDDLVEVDGKCIKQTYALFLLGYSTSNKVDIYIDLTS